MVKTTSTYDIVRRVAFTDHDSASTGETFEVLTDGKGLATRKTYDFVGRNTVIQRPGANYADPPTPTSPHKPHSLLFRYDDADRVQFSSDGQGVTIDHHYDPLDRLLVRESRDDLNANLLVSGLTAREVLNRNHRGQMVSNGTYRKDPGSGLMVLVNGTTAELDSIGRGLAAHFVYEGAPIAPLTTIASTFGSTDPDFRT
ncbi:MAG: hypothetical protein H6837_21885, partial [Planctomycetes bacterium]|nr:hypothetical protein [Planctomycetota bacterium]